MTIQGDAGSRVLIAIPALNEASSVGPLVRAIRTRYPRYDVLLIDDGSTDSTGQIAHDAGATVCRLPFNLGVGGAMRTAYKYAQRADYDVVVQVDGDGQHDVSHIPELVARLSNADLVIGARFAGVGDYPVAGPRRFAMRGLARVLSRLSHEELTDVTSGFRASGRRCIDLFAVHYPAEYLGDTVESLVIAARTGCRVDQVPVSMSVRRHGRPSQSTLRASIYLARATVALTLAVVRQWPIPEPIAEAELAPSQGTA